MEGDISNHEGLILSYKKQEDENNSGLKSLKDGETQRNFEGFETPKSDRIALQEVKFPRLGDRDESMSEVIIEN